MDALENKKNITFLILCFSIIFNNIPKYIQLPFVGGPFTIHLIVYPMIMVVILTAYSFIRPHNDYMYNLVNTKMKYWSYTYLFILFVSLILGLFQYPYWELVFVSPINQIDKLPRFLNILHSMHFYPNPKFIFVGWIIFRELKGIFIDFFWCFGGAFLIFLWWKNSLKTGISLLQKGIFLDLILIFSYSIIEVYYLSGNLTAEYILKVITPYLHAVNIAGGWWPPLLSPTQVRMVFSEPSMVGNYISLAYPALTCYYLQTRNKLALVSIFLLAFFVFCSQSRTAYAMLCGIVFILFVLILINQQRTNLLKVYFLVVLVTIMGFFMFLQFSYNLHRNYEVQNGAEQVISENLLSLQGDTKRSNGARYGRIRAYLRVFKDHPILGVGKGLSAAYASEKLSNEEKQNPEIKFWVKNQEKFGPFAKAYILSDALNEYITRLAQTGIIGTLLFLGPFLYVLCKAILIYKVSLGENGFDGLFLISSTISCLASGCNLSLNIFYSIWILLGLDFVYINKNEQEKAAASHL